MRQYIIRRLIQSVFILFILSIVVFTLLRVAPGGNPALLRCGLNCPKERLFALEEEMGLHDPYFPVSATKDVPLVTWNSESQYWSWFGELFTGSLGRDFNNLPVRDELERRLPVTLELMIITVIFIVLVGIPFGIVSAVARNSPADYGARLIAILGLAVPSFWLATMVILVPQERWGYVPPLTGTVAFFDNPWENLRQFVPPAIVLGAAASAGVMRLTRSAMLEVMRQDYIRTARSKGLREYLVIGRHALKNSLIPVVTVLGLQVAALLGGTVIIERVFNLQGIGEYFIGALTRRDYQVAQTLTVYIGAAVVLLNLSVDVAYAWLDPRIRYS